MPRQLLSSLAPPRWHSSMMMKSKKSGGEAAALLSSATQSSPPGGSRQPTTLVFVSAPALSWVLLLAAYGDASGPNELAWRRPRYGYTRDDVRSARRSVLRPRVF